MAGLYRYTKNKAPTGTVAPKFMSTRDPTFSDLHGAMEVHYKLLCEGVGAAVKHAFVVTPEEEKMLWDKKVIGDHSPLALLKLSFNYIGKTFV